MHHVYNVRILLRKYNLSQFYNTHIFILIPIIIVYVYLSFSSYLHINIFGVNYSVEEKEGGGGGLWLTFLGILDGGVPPGTPNPGPIYILDQKPSFRPVFRPGL